MSAGTTVEPHVWIHAGDQLDRRQWSSSSSGYDTDDYATVTVEVPIAGVIERATYRLDGRA